jgi:hypothetical protein
MRPRARALHLRALLLAGDAALLAGARRLRRDARFRHDGRGAHHLGEPRARVLAVALLRAEALRRRSRRASRRSRTRSGSDGLRATSKRSSTAVATLLTFCPPGPLERTKRSTSSSSGMAMDFVTGSMARF